MLVFAFATLIPYDTSMNTSSERVDALMRLSDTVYPAIDERLGGEHRSRRIVRLGINAVAHELKQGDRVSAGTAYESILKNQLERGGIHRSHYGDWPRYQSHLTKLPDENAVRTDALTELANKYSDVKRAVIDTKGKRERNSRHAVHLSALSLPYAAEFHPDLNLSLIALYTLNHDLLEAFTGDVPTLGISDEAYQLKNEEEVAALERLEFEYGQQWPEFVQVMRDYEAMEDEESKFVKTFDKTDPSYTHFSTEGRQLREFYGYTSSAQFMQAIEATTIRMQAYSGSFPNLMQDRLELLNRVADHTRWPATDVSTN